MTREEIKTITDIVHKTIYTFFDVCGDDEEVPMSEKDKLLLSVNKAICKGIRELEQEPCEDWYDVSSDEMTLKQARQAVKDLRKKLAELPPVTPQEPKTGHWIIHGDYDAMECDKCGRAYSEYDYNAFNYCPSCGARMVEPQESDIEKRKPCINYEDGCEEWAGCPCVYYKAESEDV